MKVVQTKGTMNNIYLDAVWTRHQVFVIKQGVPLSREVDKDEAHYIHLVLYPDKKEPQGTVRFLPLENGKTKLQRMVILSEYRHQGLEKISVERAESFAKSQSYNATLLGAQSTVETFYEKLRYTTYGNPSEGTGMPRIYMKKTLQKFISKKAKNSKLLRKISH